MATQPILRNSIRSPIRATLQRTASTRSILKRPILPLSPAYPFAACSTLPVSTSLRSSHVHFLPSPAVTEFEDPRSPKVQPAAKQNYCFLAFTSIPSVTRSSRTLGKSMASYPRSPYPSASLVPPGHYNDINTDDSHTHRGRSSSLELPRRNKKGLTLGSSATLADSSPSSLGRPVFSPFVNKGGEPAPLDLESGLSQAFWEAFSLEEAEISADEVMFTALEYPPSAVQPQIMYANADGALWSPALPKPGAAVDRIRESLMSPGNRSSISGIVRQDFTAPSPNDPFAVFPSFTAAMEGNGAISYPSRVALE